MNHFSTMSQLRATSLLTLTTETLCACLQDEEASSRFMEDYRSQPLSVVYRNETQEQEVALEHLTLSELRMLAQFAQEEGMEYKALDFQFRHTYLNPVSELVREKWGQLLSDMKYIDLGTRVVHNGVTVYIHLRRNLRHISPGICPRLQLECGDYQGLIPEEHWLWLQQQGFYRSENFALSRRIVDYSYCAHQLSQPTKVEYVMNGVYFDKLKQLHQLRHALLSYDADQVRKRARILYSMCTDSLSHRAMNALLHRFPNHTLQLPAKESLCAFVVHLQHGNLPETESIENRGQFVGLRLALKKQPVEPMYRYYASEVFASRGFGFIVHYLLYSPSRALVLQAFHPEEREKVLCAFPNPPSTLTEVCFAAT